MIFGFSKDGKLFPGSNQYDRYTKSLKRAMATESVSVDLADCGFAPSDFGSHSARKGAATYVSSCSTSSPPAASICLRSGWSLPGVQNSYIRYEAAGDMIVGRFVRGLAFEKPEFASQPPSFAQHDPIIDHCVAMCFSTAPPSFKKLCGFCVASIANSASYLQATPSPNHLLLQTPLFRDPAVLNAVISVIECRSYRPTDPIRPTGIHPHIGMLVTLTEVKVSIDNVLPAMRYQLRGVMDEQQVRAGCGAAVMAEVITEVLKRHGVVAPAIEPPQQAP